MPRRQPPPPPPRQLADLIDSAWVTEPTRRAFHARSAPPDTPAQAVLDAEELRLLDAVVGRLVPQPAGPAVPIAATLHANLAAGKRDGWRYAALPPDPDAYRLGLTGIAETAKILFGRSFCDLPGDDQDLVLAAIEDGWAPSMVWASLSSLRFFEELLSEAVEIFVSHPRGADLMGYRGMADARGFRNVGLNGCDPVDFGAPDDPLS